MASSIPVIDFSKASTSPEDVAKDLLQACSDWGFFYIKNHPISQEDVDAAFAISQQFFAQDEESKSKAPYDTSRNAGFKPATADRPREAFSINKIPNESSLSSADFPPVLSDHRTQIASFQRHCHDLATKLLELISRALGLSADMFTSQHPFEKQNFDNFEIMHYPPLKQVLGEVPTATTTYRIAPHTDWGTITLLFMRSQNPVPGLEVRPPSYTSPELDLKAENWTPASPIPGAILINIADMLEFWSAGRLKSTWHRVVPPPENLANQGRYSIAYFLHPDKDVVLEPIKSLERDEWTPRYEGRGRTAEEHIHARIRGIHGNEGPEEKTEKVVAEVDRIVIGAA